MTVHPWDPLAPLVAEADPFHAAEGALVSFQATFTDTAPYAFEPGVAASRSPTSRCTITRKRSIAGASSSARTTTGVATLYGRFDTITQRS